MNYVVYMIRSESTGKYYYGHTSNLEQRLISHNSTQNKSTRNRGPWVLAASLPCHSKSQATKIELKLKRMKNPKRALAWIHASS